MGKSHSYGIVAAWDGHLIGEADAIGDISLTVDTTEASSYTSPEAFKEHIQGMIDTGQITVSGSFDADDTDGQVKFLSDMNARSGVKILTVTYPDAVGAEWVIPSLPVGFTTTQPLSGKIGYTLAVKPSGKPTLSITASNNLSELAVSDDAVIIPGFAATTYDYIATVLAGVDSVTVTPTASLGVIKVNGNVVTSGEASSAIALGASGSITTVTIEVKETGKAAKKYTVRVARA